MEVAMKREALDSQNRQFCTFWIAGRHFGVDILDVKVINSGVAYTPIFHAPEEVKGYVNIRGRLYLLLDLRRILGFESREVDADSRVVLFKSEVGEPFGIIVDSIGDTVIVGEEQIENRREKDEGAPEVGERRSLELGDGVCKLEEGLLVIVKSRNLLKLIGNMEAYSEGGSVSLN
jgi:chemotaxis signal transduction protein